MAALRQMFGLSKETPKQDSQKPVELLVIQNEQDAPEWDKLVPPGTTLRNGRPIKVVQCGWDEMHVHADTYSTSGVLVEIQKRDAQRILVAKPDFVLVRNEVTTPSFDGKGRLSGLMFADLPAVNTLESIFLFTDRAAIMGKLHSLHRRMGDAFPVVPQHFASSHRSLMYGYTFPAVVKVGSAHAGAGKMQIQDHHQMSDFRSVLAMMPNEHCFAEPFIVGQHDLRIQKIGDQVRSFRRTGISGDWKTNTGTALMEEVPTEPRWRAWVCPCLLCYVSIPPPLVAIWRLIRTKAEAAGAMFGGLDILTVDGIVEEGTGKEYIIEVNGTSSGTPRHSCCNVF